MNDSVNNYIQELRVRVRDLVDVFSHASQRAHKFTIDLPESFRQDFLRLVDRVCLGLMEDKDNFYGYFLFQMGREVRYDISSPTGVNFKGANYIIYFNPLIFLKLSLQQMESSIKHEILHILSAHLFRAKEFKGKYDNLAINMSMDMVVNKYLDPLPPEAVTLANVNKLYSLQLAPYATFEYYVEELQKVVHSEEDKDKSKDKVYQEELIAIEFNPSNTHDLWEESDDIDHRTMDEFTQKMIQEAKKGEIPAYLESILAALKNTEGELPWNLYLQRIMGSLEGGKKKTITRRNRRQPDRLDLRGELRSHKAKIGIAIDTSGSISEEEFRQAMVEILQIVRNYNHELTLIECDNEIQNTYTVKSERDLKDRTSTKGGTKFYPVFEYANQNKFQLLIYFTDGKGEERLKVVPKGYQVLWIISGRGEELSLKEPYGVVKKLSAVKTTDNILDARDVQAGGHSMAYQETN